MADSRSNLLKNLGQGEVLLAMGVVGILMLLFLPIPALVLDFMFAVNIATAFAILLMVMFVQKALELSSFPMLLLITTMLRLSLNVASTRLILSEGANSTAAAGKIIETFGEVVMGGQFFIGVTIFLIFVILNFVVITKGSGRIAEVAARFTLDSLPGKQMAIDADLNAGLIDEEGARSRRKELEQETGFFGAMDGASKFVRGDAIAGIIITGINVVVGMIVGATVHDMSMGEAASQFMLLAVGDGLVAQIPALIISVSAGLLVAKSGTTTSAGDVVFKQLGSSPKAMFATAGILFSLSLIPNMPVLPFWFLAAGAGGLGYWLIQKGEEEEKAVVEKAAQEAASELTEPAEEPIASLLHIDTLRLELGYGLLNLIDESRGGRLTEQIKAMRRQMAKEIGFVVPSIRIQDNMQLEPGGYAISIKDIEAGNGDLRPGMLMAMDPTGSAIPIDGEDTVEPTFGLAAKWVDESKKEEASFNGYTVVDTSTVIVTHLTEVIKDNMADLLTRDELEKLLDEMRPTHGKLIDELVPEKLPMGSLQKILQNLLQERISIRDLPTILEALSDGVTATTSVYLLTEMVRSRLARQLCKQHEADDGVIPLIALSAAWEKEFSESLISDGEDRRLAMDPMKVQNFVKSAKEVFESQMMTGVSPVLLTSPNVRPYVRRVTERVLPQVAVMSQAEVHSKAQIRTVGTV